MLWSPARYHMSPRLPQEIDPVSIADVIQRVCGLVCGSRATLGEVEGHLTENVTLVGGGPAKATSLAAGPRQAAAIPTVLNIFERITI